MQLEHVHLECIQIFVEIKFIFFLGDIQRMIFRDLQDDKI